MSLFYIIFFILTIEIIFFLNLKFPGDLAFKITKFIFTTAHLYILVSFFLDWGYKYITFSPMSALYYGFYYFPLIHLISLIIILSNHIKKVHIIPFGLNLLQFIIIIPLVLLLEKGFKISFFTNTTVSVIAASFLGLIAALNLMLYDIPRPNSFIGKIVFLRRDRAFDALKILSQRFDLEYKKPTIFLELGSVEGKIFGTPVSITSKVKFIPPGYSLKIKIFTRNYDRSFVNSLKKKFKVKAAENEVSIEIVSMSEISIDETEIINIIKGTLNFGGENGTVS